MSDQPTTTKMSMSSPNPIESTTSTKDTITTIVVTPPRKTIRSSLTPPPPMSMPKYLVTPVTEKTTSSALNPLCDPFCGGTNATIMTPFRKNPVAIKTPPMMKEAPGLTSIISTVDIQTPIEQTVNDLLKSVDRKKGQNRNSNPSEAVPLYEMNPYGIIQQCPVQPPPVHPEVPGYWELRPISIPCTMLQQMQTGTQQTRMDQFNQYNDGYGMYPVAPQGTYGNYGNYGDYNQMGQYGDYNQQNQNYQAPPPMHTMDRNGNQWQTHNVQQMYENPNWQRNRKLLKMSKNQKTAKSPVRDLSETVKFAESTNDPKDAENTEKSKRYNISTEIPPFDVEMINEDTIRFVGIYRGVDQKQQIFILMALKHIHQFNHLASVREQQQQQMNMNEDTYYCWMNDPEQMFLSQRLGITKGTKGWYVKGQLIPFNPVCVFTFNFRTNVVTSMRPALMRGVINNVMPKHNSLWVTSELKVDAWESRENLDAEDMKCGRILGVQLDDNRHRMYDIKSRTSYLVHDWADVHGKKGDQVTFCMKLSTKTNKKVFGLNRPIFVQAWYMTVDRSDDCE